ncbi:TlpA disulfide reductase family protein [Cytophagaceae bacterium DM2B3-1]|uniref:TlpA disulfide reductase family protein n=1 Tax=Xanthocytophaga flava TaxID=3048013 RepID=A0AAE3QT38_9BACT|nr:TlpA disulfide reductase family protein [Xanthocytophaga flavus]MDJ1484890.1 TlpA disulfide reductase family protein [Xanthocytophaga flavus]MDJ1497396.1 TlpA disulfide reductase family protein [Xanthocytophaga flavus]
MTALIKSVMIFAVLSVVTAFTYPTRTGTPEAGQKAPEISLPNPQGKVIKLSSLKGKVVLLDFWASWCGPCRQSNPDVVKLYEKYKDQGFTVYSVSLDQNKQKWEQAISKDGLTWENHVSDLKFWYSKAAEDYGIEAIPATFLIDKDGVILDTDLHGKSLENAVKKALQK